MLSYLYSFISQNFNDFSVPRGLEDVSKYPVLFAELLRSGRWSIPELKGLAGLNFLRVMRRVEKVCNFPNYKFTFDACQCLLSRLIYTWRCLLVIKGYPIIKDTLSCIYASAQSHEEKRLNFQHRSLLFLFIYKIQQMEKVYINLQF